MSFVAVSHRHSAAVILLLLQVCLVLPLAHAQNSGGGGPAAFEFIVYGDPRYTDNLLKRGSERARRAILNQIRTERASFVAIVGDLVLKGADHTDWKRFDEVVAPVKAAGKRIVPVLGNHELEGGPEHVALENYFARFPELNGKRWYSFSISGCLFIVADSQSPVDPGSEQGKWIRAELDSVTPDTDYVFVLMHHPPYTRSESKLLTRAHPALPEHTAFGKELEDRQKRLRARIVVISGHVHNYERYENGGVMYVVSGGGGGTPHKIPRGDADLYRDSGETFHYVRFRVTPDRKLQFEMVKLKSRENPDFEVRDRFELTPKSGSGS